MPHTHTNADGKFLSLLSAQPLYRKKYPFENEKRTKK